MDENNEEIIEEEIVEEEGVQEKLKKMREALKKCQMEKNEYLAGWQRSKADFINARRDEERSRSAFAKFAAEKLLRELLTVADSLELAGNAGGPVYNLLLDILKKEGVMQIESLNKKFDPMYHEALQQEEVDEKEKDGVIMEELQKGYMFRDRVLRPIKVKVGIYQIKN